MRKAFGIGVCVANNLGAGCTPQMSKQANNIWSKYRGNQNTAEEIFRTHLRLAAHNRFRQKFVAIIMGQGRNLSNQALVSTLEKPENEFAENWEWVRTVQRLKTASE